MLVPEGFDDLVRRAQEGDRAAMDEVLEILRPHLEYLARPFADPSRPAVSTSDLLQETCLRAFKNIGTFVGGKNDEDTFAMFRSWIGKIVKNLGLNARRDQGRQRRSPPKKILPLRPSSHEDSTFGGGGVDAPSPGPTPSACARADELAWKVNDALEKIPDEMDASIVRMRFFEEMTFPEIAEQLGLGCEHVRERFRSTMPKLEKNLGGLL